MENNLQNTQLDDQKLKKLQNREKISKYVMIAGGVCLAAAVLIFIISGKFTLDTTSAQGTAAISLLLGGIVLFVISAVIKQNAGNAQKNIANIYAKGVLEKVMDSLDTFDPNGNVDKYYIGQEFGFPSYDRIGYCGDYVKGVLRGTALEFCEFELEYEHLSEDSDGDTDVSYEKVFYGVMVVCKHGLELSDAVTATQYKTFENEYKTDNPDFNDAFSVICSSRQDAELALTPDYMQKLIKLSSQRGRRFAVRFLKDGTLLLTIKDLNLFEMGEALDTAQLSEKLQKETEDFADIIDALAFPAQG